MATATLLLQNDYGDGSFVDDDWLNSVADDLEEVYVGAGWLANNQTWAGVNTFSNAAGITMANSANVVLGTGAGTKIGTGTTQKLGLWNATPVARPSAYTQTYATADKTLSGYTADDESGAYTGIDNAQGGTPYAQLTDLNALRTAYENLRAFVEDLAAFTNSIVDDLQSVGMVG